MSRAKSKSRIDLHRKEHVIDFLNFVARKAKTDNIDQFLRAGKITTSSDIFDCGKYFLSHALGCGENDFLPNINFKNVSCFVPQSESYYPWVFFAVPSTTDDLTEFFDHHGRAYLMSADAGKKNFALVTNFRSISVFDFNHYQSEYEVSIEQLFDAITTNEVNLSAKNWRNLVADFGIEKAEEKKKSRRKEVINYIEPREASPQLQYVRRFGHMPSFETPVGYDGQNFRETFKTKDLPFLLTETVECEKKSKKVENRLIWGDNLSIMRALPDEGLDLIYIDPPFFSGRDYNCIFGDDDEVRSFKDIWDGGLPTYLAWLNARIWEMKRLLSKNGVLLVHLDWHAAHYVKVELDKIFGYDNLINEIIWHYRTFHGQVKRYMAKKHDVIFAYAKGPTYTFNRLFDTEVQDTIDGKRWRDYLVEGNKIYGRNMPIQDSRFVRYLKRFRKQHGRDPKPNEVVLEINGQALDDVWDIKAVDPKDTVERIGYPTQKPEALMERLLRSFSNEGDHVADFFSGGGTTAAVAQKLGRKWIAADISRIAVSVARDRVAQISNKTGHTGAFTVEYHGVYERDMVREMPESEYIAFILNCYQATPNRRGDYIHGFKEDKAIFVSDSKKNLRKDQIEEFHSELLSLKIQNGVILTWNVSKEAERYVEELRKGSNGPDIQIIQVRLVDIDSSEFRGDNIRFINKPAAVIKYIRQSGLTYVFDASASCGTNGSEIHYYQWDFNFKSRFSPHTKPNFKNDKDGDGNPLNDHKRFTYTFPEEGNYKIALRIFDKSGAGATQIVELAVSKASKKAG